MGALDRKSAIITGAAQGMGASHARRFVEAGARVVLTDVQADAGERLAKELGEAARFVRHDVTSAEDWDRVIAAAQSHGGGLHALINNAAIHWMKSIADDSADALRRMLDVNVVGVFLGIQKATAPMRAAGGGSIINISSICGIIGSHANAAYHASKGAVRIFSKAAAIQYAPDQIRVNSVHPGFVDTPMTKPGHANPEVAKKRLEVTPLGRFGRPDDIANGCLYLASDESSWVTGSELVIDGGMTAN